MRKSPAFVAIVSAIIWTMQVGSAQFGLEETTELSGAALPWVTIYPEDVVQDSIRRLRMTTNQFVVRWQYTEEGAKKMQAFWDAHAGERVRTRVGNFETPPALVWPRDRVQTNPIVPWEKMRTDKFVGLRENDADAVLAGLKQK